MCLILNVKVDGLTDFHCGKYVAPLQSFQFSGDGFTLQVPCVGVRSGDCTDLLCEAAIFQNLDPSIFEASYSTISSLVLLLVIVPCDQPPHTLCTV